MTITPFTRAEANAFRYPGAHRGHYESYFQRANHLTRPLAFWIRYTAFVPKGNPQGALAELWAVYFDGEAGRVVGVREAFPMSTAQFSREGLRVSIANATLDDERLEGSARTGPHRITWSLAYASSERPLLLLPNRMYTAPLPKAKALVGAPLAKFYGSLEVDGEHVPVDGWIGSQNHNWGEKHTDRYAWGQVSGFEGAPDTFFECATARIKLGPLYTPAMSPMVLRHAGTEYRLNALGTAIKARADYGYFYWNLSSANEECAIEARFRAKKADFIALTYLNPPGGTKTCLNSKIASCEVTLRVPNKADVVLRTEHRAAFEILTDDCHHDVLGLAS